ncbi:MAG: hypothetical protein ACOYYF_15060 [Chloroflexota bacterium]
MNYKVLFVLNAVVALLAGLVLVFVPATGLAQFNMDARVTEQFLTRALGAALVSLGLTLWFAKDAGEAAQRNLGMASLGGSVLGLIVAIVGAASGIIRVNSWIPIVVFAAFALGYGFLIFIKPKMKE